MNASKVWLSLVAVASLLLLGSAKAEKDMSHLKPDLAAAHRAEIATKGRERLAYAEGEARAHHGRKGHMKQCRHEDRSEGQGRFHPDQLAQRLSVMETEIGIRSNQLDAWRDYSDALLAMMAPKSPGEKDAADRERTGAEAKPFDRARRLADNAIERGKRAEALKQAVDALSTALTPEQLEKVGQIEARLAEMRHGPGRHFGRHDRPSRGHKAPGPRGPEGPPPGARP